jgi:hypothetical protein
MASQRYHSHRPIASSIGSGMDSFRLIIECGTPDARHEHEVTISHADEVVVGVGPPAYVRLQYTCPVTGTARIMRFRPPVGAARPFAVLAVT